MASSPSIGRFVSPALLKLGPPPDLASKPYETLLDDAKAKLVADMAAINIAYDVANLETDPVIVVTESGVYRDLLRRRQIDDAVAQTYLGSATGAHLDARAADYGVLRRVVTFADPLAGTDEVLEDDESFRLRARLAWEALSVAGPAGAYVFHALDAHEGVYDAVAIGPETGLVEPGEALVVIQGRTDNSIATPGMVDAVAQRLDAIRSVYADGSTQDRTSRNPQAVRPLGARVTVIGAKPLHYDTTATLYVSGGGDREAARRAAIERLDNYQKRQRRIGARVPTSGREGALALVNEDGVAAIADVDVVEPDVIASHLEIPVARDVTVDVVVR